MSTKINEEKTVAIVKFEGLDCNGKEYEPEKISIVSYDDEYEKGIGHDSDGNAVKFDDEDYREAHEGDGWENGETGEEFVVSSALEWVEVEAEEDDKEEERISESINKSKEERLLATMEQITEEISDEDESAGYFVVTETYLHGQNTFQRGCVYEIVDEIDEGYFVTGPVLYQVGDTHGDSEQKFFPGVPYGERFSSLKNAVNFAEEVIKVEDEEDSSICEEPCEAPSYKGYVKTDDGQFLVQIPDQNAKFGFVLCDDDQTFETPPFKSWVPVEASEVPQEDKDRLGWLLEEEEEN